MRVLLFLLTLLTLNGCGTGGANNPLAALAPAAPTITLKSFELVKVGLTEQSYKLRFNIKNPNAFALPIQALNYQLFVNNKAFFKGANNQPVTVPALGESAVETTINGNISNVVEGWKEWFSLAKRTVDYRVVGDVSVSSLGIAIPFQYSDKVDLTMKATF